MNRFYISLLLGICIGGSLNAKKINESEALNYAQSFFNSQEKTRAISPSVLSADNFDENIFIINNSAGGWVIMAADDRVPQMVLGYSKTGNLDKTNLNPSISAVLKNFSEGIEKMDGTGTVVPNLKTRSADSVEPLLGEIQWHQNYPYNARCPQIDVDIQAPTGCVANAVGDIMYYHKYPEKGKGSNSYEWNGKNYSADFSKSVYQWDLMKPVYNGTEDKASIDAVANFMYDLMVALEANFGFVTSASLWGDPLVRFFDYDPGIIMVNTSRCTREYFEETMREDISAGRPVYIQAYNEYMGGHAFVCDGYDDKGYFHYNMGGDTGGYFLSSATGWDRMPTAFCNIQPNKGGAPGLWAGSEKEFLWTKGNNLKCDVRGDITSNVLANIDVALAAKNVKTNAVNYYVKQSLKNTTFFEIEELTFADKVDDGDYEIYPVCRVNNGDWQKIHFADYAADYVKVNVKNGVKTYTNTSTGGPLGEGVILIDGVYYTINNDEATVTSRNNLYGSYSGDVVIPATIDYNGESYPVTHIGMSAFQESNLGTVVIGENVRSLGWYAFRDAHVGKIEYVNEKNLTTLEERAFYDCYIDELRIPSGVTSLYFLTYSGTSRVLDIPESVSFMASQSVGYATPLKDIYVHWNSEESLPECVVDPANGIGPLDGKFTNVTLHVPKGCTDIYKNHPIWKIFKNITDDSAGVGSIETDGVLSKIRVENGIISFESLPFKENASVFNINGKLVGKFKAGDSLQPGKGVYIIQVGKESIKVII